MRPTLQHAMFHRRGAGAAGERRRLAKRAAVLLATVALPAALVVHTATPAEAAPVTVTFNAGADQPFTVPSGVTQLTVTATGAAGQNGPNGSAGGNGATVTGTVAVPPSTTTLYVNVGTGGGAGGGPVTTGGAGGGASDVRTCSSAGPGCTLTGVPGTDPRLIVAGGGGGGASSVLGFLNPSATGGNAGNTGGAGGDRTDSGKGGGGGTQTAGGTAGAACPFGGTSGAPGTGGAGGTGGGAFGAGGGGGGWFGGGGGGGCNEIRNSPPAAGPGGGGGGSNRVPTGGTSGPAAGPAQVTITYEPVPPTCANVTPANPQGFNIITGTN
ncbi:hypothetical protein ACFRLW_45730, partial [Streptomyces sp. NPDC056728]